MTPDEEANHLAACYRQHDGMDNEDLKALLLDFMREAIQDSIMGGGELSYKDNRECPDCADVSGIDDPSVVRFIDQFLEKRKA